MSVAKSSTMPDLASLTTPMRESRRNPHVVQFYGEDESLLDSLTQMNGLDAARVILESAPETPILIFSAHRSKQLVEAARRIGVRGYVTKGETFQNLIRAAKAVRGNETFFPSDL